MSTIRSLLQVLCVLMMPTIGKAQGCSDAGVCTAGPLGEIRHDGPDSLVTGSAGKHFVRLTASYGIGERVTSIVQSVAEVGFSGDLFGIQLRVPYMAVWGDLGSNNGVGDPVVTLSFPFRMGEKNRLELIGGVKFPANRANASVEGRSLPMPYQTSLGTTDLLGGIQYRRGRFSAAIAYQHVAQQFNENGFTHGHWLDDMAAVGYFPSAGLRRADDAVMRLQFATHRGRLSIQPGLLAIYHMDMDERVEAIPNVVPSNLPVLTVVDIPGSEGLTLNVTVDGRYRLNDDWSLDLSYGYPVIVREQRPDGLTRFMVTNLSITRRF